MQVYEFPKVLPKGKKTLILGAFGAFHNGHKKLIDAAKELGKPIVLMMIEGISQLASKGSQYNTIDVRLQQFANCGVDYVSVVQFKDVALLPGLEFLEKITKQTGANAFVAGKEFAMGKDRDLKIKDIPNSIIINTLKISDKKISSTILKELVEVGDVKLIRSLAPYYYQMNVHVSSENEVTQEGQVIPHIGVYAIWMNFNEVQYPGLIHINREKQMFIEVPDFRVKNTSYDPTISFVKLVKKIYKDNHNEVTDEDRKKVNKALNEAEYFVEG